MRKIVILVFIIGIFTGLIAEGADIVVKEKEAIAVIASGQKTTVTVRQVNPVTYEVTTRTPTGTERRIISVRQTVGNSYEVTTHK